MERIPISDAKTHLLRLVREAMIGKTFAITKGGRVVARLVPAESEAPLPRIGFAKVKVIGDIISPLPNDWTYDIHNFPRPTSRKKKRS